MSPLPCGHSGTGGAASAAGSSTSTATASYPPADPHAEHPFRRYYLGPSPISSRAAMRVARAIQDDVGVRRPVGWTTVGGGGGAGGGGGKDGEGVVVIGGDRGEGFAVNQAPAPAPAPASSSSPFRRRRSRQGSSGGVTSGNITGNDVSFSSARDAASVASVSHDDGDEETAAATSTRATRLGQRSSSPLRSSSPQRATTADSLLAPPAAGTPGGRRRKLELREIPSIHSLKRGRQQGEGEGEDSRGGAEASRDSRSGGAAKHDASTDSRPGGAAGPSSGLHARFIDSVDERQRSQRKEPSADQMIDVGLTPAADTGDDDDDDDADDDHAAGPSADTSALTHRRARQQSVSLAVTDPSSTQQPPQRPPHRTMLQGGHGRDFSRQSRMSRASTAGTFASAGTRVTDDSFGATGGVRARLAKVFSPTRRRPAGHRHQRRHRPSRSASHTSFGSAERGGHGHGHTRLSANALAAAAAAASTLNRHAAGDDMSDAEAARQIRQSWTSGVAPGHVGTSAGGTKWVGQSFEVGGRLRFVLGECHRRWQSELERQRERDGQQNGDGQGWGQGQGQTAPREQQQRRYSTHAPHNQAAGPSPTAPSRSLPKIVTTGVDEEEDDDDGGQKSPKASNVTANATTTTEIPRPPARTRHVTRSPSDVLSAFAKHANMAADVKRAGDDDDDDDGEENGLNTRQIATVTTTTTADSHASVKALRPPTAARQSQSLAQQPATAHTATRGGATNASPRRTSFVPPKRAISITSLHPEAATTATPTAPAIESRQGWSNIASLMSAQPALLQSSKLHRSIIERAEDRVRAVRSPRGAGLRGADKAAAAAATPPSSSDAASVAGIMSSAAASLDTPFTPAGQVFKTPMETFGGGAVDYFGSAVGGGKIADDDAKSAPPAQISPPSQQQPAQQPSSNDVEPAPMTTAQALTHPDPPLAAEEKYPQLTFNLLRRPSDVAASPVVAGPTNASDDAIAARPSTPPPPAVSAARRPSQATTTIDFNSPRYTLDSNYPPRLVGSSLADSEAPLLRQKTSTGSMIVHEDAPTVGVGNESYLQKTAAQPPPPTRKKTVQFEKKNGTVSARRGTPMRSLSTSLFPNSALSGPDTNANRNGHHLSVDSRTGLASGFLRSSNGSSPSGDAAPAPPHEVLARPQPDHPSPSEAFGVGSEHAPGEEFITRKSLLRRDRMLVKNDWTPRENLPQDLDEAQSRGFNIHPGQWREYIVVLRPGRIELWDDPGFADRFFSKSGQLHLAFVIPLQRGATFLSMFSHVDRIFCLTYAQSHASTHVSGGGKSKVLNLRKSGTNILLFEARNQTVGADWIWDIWREIGANLPETVEVHLPYVGLRVKFPIPEEMPECNSPDEEQAFIDGTSMLAVPAARFAKSRDSNEDRTGEGYKMISRARVVGTILRLLKTVPDYEQVLTSAMARGMRFELAWRRGSTIDWVVHDRTLDDQKRYWSILVGSILKQTRHPSVLEFRGAVHYPTVVQLGQGQVLKEPAGVEGFLWRVKPVSGTLTRIYVTSHDSHVFACRPSRAFPPERHLAIDVDSMAELEEERDQGLQHSATQLSKGPLRAHTQPSRAAAGGVAGRRSSVEGGPMKRTNTSGATREESSASLLRRRATSSGVVHVDSTPSDLAEQAEAYRVIEKQRQLDQIANADGYIDVKDIYMIRSLADDSETHKPGISDPVRAPMPMSLPDENVLEDSEDVIEQEDLIDIGGEEGLMHSSSSAPAGTNASEHRMHLRRQRQFEVVMTNGRVTRFEAYSKSVAKEWIVRLHDLATYWKRREKVDALEKMELSGFDPALIRRKMQNADAFDRMTMGGGEVDPDSPALGNVWNWCTIMGCRGIILCGRLFAKKRAFAPFASRYYILIAGRLLSYKLVTSTRTARSRQNAGIFHKKTDTVIHLKDSFTWSGKLTEEMLRDTKSEGAGAASLGQFASGGVANTMSYGGRHKIPRVYSDGLLSIDEDEDCTFVIRYRPQRVAVKTGAAGTSTQPRPATAPKQPPAGYASRRRSSMDTAATSIVRDDDKTTAASVGGASRTALPRSQPPSTPQRPPSASVPPLNDATYNLLVLRARSKLERDVWVRAIGHEKERLAREDVDREMAMRGKGQCPYKRHKE